jgi:hypothetical protein
MVVIFLGMFLVTLYATGVYQQGIRPHLEPYVMKARKAGESRKEVPAAPQVDSSKVLSSRADAPVKPEGQISARDDEPIGPGVSSEKAADPKQLVRVYERMRPKDAALIVEQLEVPLAVEILSQMPDRQAARILGAMAPDRAARITSKLAERSL